MSPTPTSARPAEAQDKPGAGKPCIRTPYSEGHHAGYQGVARVDNPYRKGIAGSVPAVDSLAQAWDDGWYDGDALAKADILDKRRAAVRE